MKPSTHSPPIHIPGSRVFVKMACQGQSYDCVQADEPLQTFTLFCDVEILSLEQYHTIWTAVVIILNYRMAAVPVFRITARP